MYFGDVWDWGFFWSVFKNFLSSSAPFLEIVIAAVALGYVLRALINAVKGMQKS
jgi:hypothetical protein